MVLLLACDEIVDSRGGPAWVCDFRQGWLMDQFESPMRGVISESNVTQAEDRDAGGRLAGNLEMNGVISKVRRHSWFVGEGPSSGMR